MYLVSLKPFQETSQGCVGGYLFYSQAFDRFVTYDVSSGRVTSYAYHDLEELIAMANRRLSGSS